jgi:nucleotide-binding universal stress UspA family protein
MIKKILIGIDDSKFADHAVKYGFELAKTLNAHVGLVHMVEPMDVPMSTGANEILGSPMQGLGVNDMELLNAQTAVSEDIMARAAKKYGDKLQVTHFNEYGPTAEGIIDCSHEFKADLIVIGTHNRTGLDRLFSGSVAEHVIRHSNTPVLVVPSKEEE